LPFELLLGSDFQAPFVPSDRFFRDPLRACRAVDEATEAEARSSPVASWALRLVRALKKAEQIGAIGQRRAVVLQSEPVDPGGGLAAHHEAAAEIGPLAMKLSRKVGRDLEELYDVRGYAAAVEVFERCRRLRTFAFVGPAIRFPRSAL
jgi:hypothetical protein